ncbi:MAG: P-II family nitrogen regulator [Candidatus Krumholzibacteriia bacterium]
MKEIKAYIQNHKLQDVSEALSHIDGLTGMSVLDCRGFGKGWGSAGAGSNADSLGYRKHAKIEVFCSDDLAAAVITAIQQAAHTGLKGDGKIYVADISHAVRISTGETGESAV